MNKLKLIIFMLAATAPFTLAGSAHALSGSEFQAGRVIDDQVFFDGNAMSAIQVQSFLASKVTTCDVNGDQYFTGYYGGHTYSVNNSGNAPYNNVLRRNLDSRYPAPYTCLKDYLENTSTHANNIGTPSVPVSGGISAAQIIYNEAQNYSINPKVLLVLVQKESSLVTDDWPWPNEYRTATGYGCPDTAACDSTYYGFYNQVHNAARQFRIYANNPNSYNYVVGQNNVYYNPNASCGTKAVNILNQATLGLYIYTPYTPNQAALDNLYGTGDGCSAYGNRNFWRLYNDWFGTPYQLYLARTPQNSSVYLMTGQGKYTVTNLDSLSALGILGAVRYVSQSVLDAEQTIAAFQRIAVAADGTVYLLDSGQKFPFSSCDMIITYNSGCGRALSLPDSVLKLFTTSSTVTNIARDDNGSIYKIEAGQRRAVPDLDTYISSGLNSTPRTQVSNGYMSTFDDGAPILRDSVIVADRDTSSAFLYLNSTAMPVTSFSLYVDSGIYKLPTYRFSTHQIDQIPKASVLLPFVSAADGTKYLLDHSSKRPLGILAADYSSSFTPLPDALLNPVTTGAQIGSVVKSDDNGTIYVIERGIKRPILGPSSFINLGYSWSAIESLRTSTVSGIASGNPKLASLDLLKTTNDSTVYMISGNQALPIPLYSLIPAFGGSGKTIYTGTDSWFVSYPKGSNLTRSIAISGIKYVVDLGKKWALTSTIQSSYGYADASFLGVDIAVDSLLPTSSQLLPAFIKEDTGTIYWIDSGSRHPLTSWQAYTSRGGTSSNTFAMSNAFIATIAQGANAN